MKVAIINITNGGISGGYKKYLLNIIPRLAVNSDIKSLLCISPNSLHVDTWFKSIPNVEFLNCSPHDFIQYGLGRTLREKLKQFSPDLIFVPVARSFSFERVTTLNMMQNIFPFLRKKVQGLSFRDRIVFALQYFESIRAFKQAKRIIVTSNFARDYLINNLDIPSEKISLIYFGKDSYVQNDTRPNSIPFGLEKKFLFTAGSLESYRGIEDIIEAARFLRNDFPDLKIVIAGKARPAMRRYHKKLLRLCESYSLSVNIIWVGQLSQAEIAWCYQNCAVFIITTRMETFGMIALEAMTNGCLCIAADNPPLPEIFLDSAYYYPPKDYRALADVIIRVLALDNEAKLEMKNKAKIRAEYFTWDKAADGLIKEFKAVIEVRKK
ncbi:MAG: glycosyltransferase family 4 protein [Candidatus Omnitrophica bacterium]|nr:glycosyltransferase family 4 protein [Candidatus Omnitrophota bacterium]